MSVIGKVDSLWRYPVKSMRGEELEEAFMVIASLRSQVRRVQKDFHTSQHANSEDSFNIDHGSVIPTKPRDLLT